MVATAWPCAQPPQEDTLGLGLGVRVSVPWELGGGGKRLGVGLL